jgi:hypothetical protein
LCWARATKPPIVNRCAHWCHLVPCRYVSAPCEYASSATNWTCTKKPPY